MSRFDCLASKVINIDKGKYYRNTSGDNNDEDTYSPLWIAKKNGFEEIAALFPQEKNEEIESMARSDKCVPM